MKKKRVVVIGAGASGLMASIQAAELGAETILVEKMMKVGRKLRISGKGRCNLSNSAPIEDFIRQFGVNGKFLRQSFHRFFTPDLIRFFNELGIQMHVERGGRIFPKQGEAEQIVDVLFNLVKEKGIQLILNTKVDRFISENEFIKGAVISPREDDRSVKNERSKNSDSQIAADRFILATGGMSYPATGSTGDGYQLAESVGHTIIPLAPALVPLKIETQITSQLDGLHLRNANVSIIIHGKKTEQAFGEVEFHNYGLSGPVILTLSHRVVEALQAKKKCEISIDLKPALDHRKLDNRLLRDFKKFHRNEMQSILKGLLPLQLIDTCCEETRIFGNKVGADITADERKRLRMWLKDFRINVTGHLGFDRALVTAGGVDVREVYPRSMKSRLIDNLYFAGEILDIAGNTGGYNLQAAFSTGWLAGQSAATD